MYAVIESGGKQYRVTPGDTLKVEKINAEAGASVEFDRVLLVAAGDQITVGSPLVEGIPVSATVVGHGRGEKIRVFKMKRRKDYRRTQGHRQAYTELKITTIGNTKSEPASTTEQAAETPTSDTQAESD